MLKEGVGRVGQPAAKKGDQVVGTDTHIVMVPQPTGPPVPTPLPHPFRGMLDGNLSLNVKIMGQPAATVGSTASNQPPHFPTPPGTSFQVPPQNRATIMTGSVTVKINGKQAARNGDRAQSCFDVPGPPSTVVAVGTVLVG